CPRRSSSTGVPTRRPDPLRKTRPGPERVSMPTRGLGRGEERKHEQTASRDVGAISVLLAERHPHPQRPRAFPFGSWSRSMIFIWGDKLLGTIYQVPGVCHVATVFFHIFFFPLIPRRTYIVVDGASAEIEEAINRGTIRHSVYGFWGMRISMSPWSVLFGYI